MTYQDGENLQDREDVMEFFRSYVDVFRYLNKTKTEDLKQATLMEYARNYTTRVAALEDSGLNVGFSPGHQAVEVSNGFLSQNE